MSVLMLATLLFMEQASFVKLARIFEFKCKPDHGVLRKKLNVLFADRYEIHLVMKHVIWVIHCVAFYEKPGYIAM